MRGGDRAGGVVPVAQDGVALVGAENVEPADRRLRIGRHGFEQPDQPSGQRLDAAAVEQVRLIVEPQLQLRTRNGGKAERIVCRVVPLDMGQPHAAGFCGQAAAVDRVVLEHDQRVEQLAHAEQRLDLGKPQMLMRDQAGLAVLQLLEQLAQRLGRRQLEAQRQGVDEQPHHGLDAGDLRRPARHRDAKHHVVAAGQTSQQNAPGGLQQCVQRQALQTSLPAQR